MRCLCTLFLEETALLGVRKIPFLEAAPFQRAGPAVLGRCPAFVCVRGVPISDAALRLVSCAGVERAGNEVMPRSRGEARPFTLILSSSLGTERSLLLTAELRILGLATAWSDAASSRI